MISQTDRQTKQELTGFPSIDKPWLKYYGEEALRRPLPEGSMYDYMTFCNADRMDTTALNYFGRKITHRQMQAQIDKCAKALTAYGVRKGDVVSLCTLAMPEAVYLLYAINKIGAIANMLVLNATEAELHEKMASTESKFVLTVNLVLGKIIQAAKGTSIEHIVGISLAESMPFVIGTLYKWKSKEKQENCISYREFLKAGESQKVESPEIKADDSAIIAYTGGTTGKAKGVLLSNRAANVIGFQYKHADKVLDFQKGERFLDIIPPFLAYGLFLGVHMALCTCLEDILCPDPAPEHFPQLFLKYRPNHLSGGPLHIEAMMKDKKIQKMNLSFAKTVAYGGDGMNQEWEDAMSRFLKERHAPYELTSGYGMTEMAGPVCVSNHKFSVMLPLFCNNIKVLDIDTGEELGYDQEGEICVSGPTMMLEYYKNPEATREIIFEENGTKWLRTGDLGHVTKEGYFRLTGRLKRILWSVGADKTPSRVYPMEIENVLCKQPNVDKCAVVGRVNGEKGYLVIAYVTLKSKEAENDVEKELRQLCIQELKENSWPLEYHFVEKLPTTGAGKIDFRTLEKWAEKSETF